MLRLFIWLVLVSFANAYEDPTEKPIGGNRKLFHQAAKIEWVPPPLYRRNAAIEGRHPSANQGNTGAAVLFGNANNYTVPLRTEPLPQRTVHHEPEVNSTDLESSEEESDAEMQVWQNDLELKALIEQYRSL